MPPQLIDPAQPLEAQNAKLRKIVDVLMRRVEQATDDSGAGFAHFQRALVLEEQVGSRTRDLERALGLLNRSNARLSEAMLEAERARGDLTDAIEAVREGFALFDADDALVMWNSRFGLTLPDVAEKLTPGLRFRDYVRLVASSPNLMLPNDQTRRGWMRERLLNHRKQAVHFNVSIAGDRWLQVSEQRTPGNGTAILQTEITELIQMERQERDKLLDEQARLIRATLDHIDQGICIFDANGRLVGWNDRLRTLLTPPMQLLRVGTGFGTVAQHLRSVLSSADASRLAALVAWVESVGVRPPLALGLRTTDGLHLDILAQEMPDRGFVVSFADVTAEREAKLALQAANEGLEQRVTERTLALEDALAAAERANASKSRFVAAASHDLLQPLSAAKLFLASLENADDADRPETIRRMRSAFESVESILDALLDISRLDSGRATVTLSSFPLDDLLTRLGAEFREIARQKGLDLRVVPSGAVVASDASYLRRIVANLLSNAIRYTARGKVLLGARRVRGGVRIEVWDTGIGIPEDKRALIFREFHRLQGPASADGGMGLGLAIVERACQLLELPLDLVSEPGRGTGFRVLIPTVEAWRRPQAEPPPARDTLGNATAGLIVLVIENDASVRFATTTLLEGWGADVLDVASIDEAERLLDDIGIAPDVMLADYHLDGDQTGLDAIALLRRRHGEPLPAALVTADRSRAIAEACREAGVLLLNKPVEPARLRALLNAAHRDEARTSAP